MTVAEDALDEIGEACSLIFTHVPHPQISHRKREGPVKVKDVMPRSNPIARFTKELATRIVHCHLKTMERLQVFYNLLNWESDILERGFWDAAFERLKASGAIVYETEGPNAGCWVVPFGGIVETKEGIKSQDKILVRSSGTVTVCWPLARASSRPMDRGG